MANIKQIIAEEYRLFLEGKAEDLIQRFPELQPAYDMGIRNPQYLQWIQKRRAGEPVEDVAGLVKKFDAAKDRLKQAGKSPDIYGYKTAGLLRQAIEDLGASKGSEKRRLKQEETTYLGTFGDWTVAMPHTKESSCQLGKGTTWCTAATQSQNLFLSYVGRKKGNIILYYIIKKGVDSRKDPNAKLSVGFVDGKPVLEGQDGHISVNADNQGLTKYKLQAILGQQYSPIMDAMQKHADSIGGMHPAKKQMEKIANDPAAYFKKMNSMQKYEANDFAAQLVEYNPNKEIFDDIIKRSEKSTTIRTALIESEHTPPEYFVEIVKYSRENRGATNSLYNLQKIAKNPATPPELLDELSRDSDYETQKNVASNPNTPITTLIYLAKRTKGFEPILYRIIRNPSTPDSLIKDLIDGKLGFDLTFDLIQYLLKSERAPIDFLIDKSKSKNFVYREQVAGNPRTPPEILLNLANDDVYYVIRKLVKNPNTPSEALKIILETSDADDEEIIKAVLQHPNTSPEVISSLIDESNWDISFEMASSPNTPPEILARLSQHSDDNIIGAVLQNPSTPVEILKKYAQEDKLWWDKYLALNPSTPLDILLKIKQKDDYTANFRLSKNPTFVDYQDQQDGLLDEKKKKKKKSKGKKDACYHKVRARYDVWPSAYASGALVKCRKVGAKNWGNKSKKNEGLELDDRLLQIIQEEYQAVLDEKKKRKKAGTESSKESNLGDWFKRKGAPGKKGGWVDCNTCRKGKCKPCGRKDGEKRAKYPSCRPTPGACKEKGKGKSWGKKSAKSKK